MDKMKTTGSDLEKSNLYMVRLDNPQGNKISFSRLSNEITGDIRHYAANSEQIDKKIN